MEHVIDDAQLYTLAYMNRENAIVHRKYSDESSWHDLVKEGNLSIKDHLEWICEATGAGTLSDDPLRNAQYLFVCATTMATRKAIEGGLSEEIAYNASDLYIKACDRCTCVGEVQYLTRDMVLFFTERVARVKRVQVYSKPVVDVIRMVDSHLHEHIQVQEIAESLSLTPNYLSTLFRKETGITIADYIQRRRIECAKNMLRFSDESMTQISEILAFSSPAHFTNSFRKEVGISPSEYRKQLRGTVSESIAAELSEAIPDAAS